MTRSGLHSKQDVLEGEDKSVASTVQLGDSVANIRWHCDKINDGYLRRLPLWEAERGIHVPRAHQDTRNRCTCERGRRRKCEPNQIACYQRLFFQTAPTFRLLLTAKDFLVSWILFGIDEVDRAIDFGRSTSSAGKMIFDSLLERTRASAVQVMRLEAKQIEPGWHEFVALIMMLSLVSALARPPYNDGSRTASLGTLRPFG